MRAPPLRMKTLSPHPSVPHRRLGAQPSAGHPHASSALAAMAPPRARPPSSHHPLAIASRARARARPARVDAGPRARSPRRIPSPHILPALRPQSRFSTRPIPKKRRTNASRETVLRLRITKRMFHMKHSCRIAKPSPAPQRATARTPSSSPLRHKAGPANPTPRIRPPDARSPAPRGTQPDVGRVALTHRETPLPACQKRTMPGPKSKARHRFISPYFGTFIFGCTKTISLLQASGNGLRSPRDALPARGRHRIGPSPRPAPER